MMNRKIIAAFTIALLVVSITYVYSTFAATSATITATADKNPTSIGQNFQVSINIAGAENLWGWNINVSWNPAVLNATKVSKGPFLESNGDSAAFPQSTIDNVNGTIRGGPSQVLLTTGSVSGDGVLAKINFTVVGTGSTTINLNNVRLLDPSTSHQEEPFTMGTPLTINIPSASSSPSPSTSPTPTPSGSPGQAAIHVYTDQIGYSPGDLVYVYANVTYNGGAVVSSDVAFTIRMQNNTNLATLSSRTDSTGIAQMSFRIPEPQPSADVIFGSWSILASVAVADSNITGTATFNVGCSLVIVSVAVPSGSVARLSSLPVNITLRASGDIPQGLTLTTSLFDSALVPLGTTAVSMDNLAQGNTTFRVMIPIPSWAFTGQGMVYVNVLTAAPDQGGVPYCSQATAQPKIS
jgi:hypothetical protein